MFDSQCDLAALVYEGDQDPDEVLRGFASDLKARGWDPLESTCRHASLSIL